MRFKLLRIMMLIWVVNVTKSCEEGCLSCNDSNECILCDMFNNYTKFQSKCSLVEIPNCEFINTNGLCSQCAENFTLVKSKNVCEKIADDKILDNCLVYELDTCVLCKDEFFIQNGECKFLDQTVENCEEYMSDNLCKKCKKGFVLSLDFKSCETNSNLDKNCAIFSPVYCEKCKPTFSLNLDFYKIYIKNALLNDNNLRALEIFDQMKKDYNFPGICLEPFVENCEAYDEYSKCVECKEGFTLTILSECIPQPDNPIEFCKKYKNLETCLECENGYSLLNEKKCNLNIQIDNCLFYLGNTVGTTCKECISGYYLKTNNNCTKRNKSFNNCITYMTNQEKCEECRPGYALNDIKETCLPMINFCKTYKSFTDMDTSPTCLTCENGFYLSEDEKFCVKGDVLDCKIYNKNSICEICEDKYYLTSSNTCLEHPFVDKCVVYSNNTIKDCHVCSEESIRFKVRNNCQLNLIEGCEIYNDGGCSICKDGYDNIGNSSCQLMDTGTNCLKSIDGKCVKCFKGFILINGNCLEPFEYEIDQCLKNNLDGMIESRELFECEICLKFSVPYEFQHNSVCVKKEVADIINLDPNCLIYDNLSQDCLKCEENYYINGSSCVLSCGLQQIKNLDLETKGNGNKLLLKADKKCVVDSCPEISPLFYQLSLPIVSYSCSKCPLDHLQVLNINEVNATFNFKEEPLLENEQSFFLKPKMECSILSPSSIKGGKIVENCDYYYALHHGEFGCLKCANQYKGLIKQWKVNNCYSYDNTTKLCTKCVNSYVLSNNGLECIKLEVIAECRFYHHIEQKCLSCNEGYYLTISGTQCNNLSKVGNCLYYSNYNNACIKCEDGYGLLSSLNFCYKKVDNCLIEVVPTSISVAATCNNCDDGYYISNDKLSCVLGTIENCWRYVQDNTLLNQCEFYINVLNYVVYNYCKKPVEIEGCLKYSSLTICSLCDNNEYFLTNNKCCKYGHYWNGTSCQLNAIENCRINLTTFPDQCDSCDSKYFFDEYQYELTPSYKCCPNKTYYHPLYNQCIDFLDLSTNELNCAIYDFVLQKCVNCRDGFYFSDSNSYKCCPNSTYDNLGSCFSITGKPFCTKINNNNPLNKICVECAPTNSSGIGIYLIEGNCCLETQYFNGSICVNKPTNCATFDSINMKCSKCATNYYKTDEETFCCKNETFGSPEFFNGSICQTISGNIPNPVTNCQRYNKNKVCIKCSGTKYPSDDGLHCCEKGTVWITNDCYPVELLTKNCLALNNNHSCSKCETGYYLFNYFCVPYLKALNASNELITIESILNEPNCTKISLNRTTCLECVTDYYVVNSGKNCCKYKEIWLDRDGPGGVPGKCAEIENLVKGCLNYNFVTMKCDSNSCFAFDYETYINNNGTICCSLGYYESGDGICQPIPVSDCLKYDGSTCFLENGSLSKLNKPNCEIYSLVSGSDYSCLKCKDGFVLISDEENNSNPCINIQYLNSTTCVAKKISDNCEKKAALAAADQCECLKCKDFYYPVSSDNNICCSSGTKYESGKCNLITNVNNCAVLSSTDPLNCSECFHLSSYSIKAGDFTYNVSNKDPGLYKNYKVTEISDNSNLYLGSDTFKCCKKGEYYNSTTSLCTPIPISNCSTYENNTCTNCAIDYISLNNGLICCRINEIYDPFLNKCLAVTKFESTSCPVGQYKSNNHCCNINHYYDLDRNLCVIHLDPFCEESNLRTTCSKCESGYVLDDTVYYKASINAEFENKFLIGFKEELSLHLCQLSLDVENNIGSWVETEVNMKNCNIYNINTKMCDTCAEGFYKTSNYSYCIEKSKYGLKNSADLISNLPTRMGNCLNYDPLKHECLRCASNTTLKEGICCANGTFYSYTQKACSISISNCLEYSYFLNVCTKCDTNFYTSGGICCQKGYRYYKETGGCQEMTEPGLASCEIYDDKIDKCLECDSATTDYLLFGRCCQEGTFWNGEKCDVVTDVTLVNCKYFNLNKECTTCKTNYIFKNGGCCASDQYFIDNQCYRIPFTNCLKINNVPKCTECESGYTLVSGECFKCATGFYLNQQPTYATVADCIQEGYFRATLTTTTAGTSPDCKYYNDATTCVLIGTDLDASCKNSKYFTDGRCCGLGTFWDGTACINTDFLADGMTDCKKIEVTGGPCIQCSLTTYLTDGKCCGLGTFWDGTACSNADFLADGMTDCEKIGVLGGPCIQCNTNTYLTDEKCCALGTFWDGTACSNADFLVTSMTNCQKIDKIGGKCIQCDPTSSNYISNGRCCASGEYADYTDLTICVAIANRPNCVKIDGVNCVECSVNPLYINPDPQCCKDHYFNYSTKECVILPTLCSIFNYSTSKCERCDETDGFTRYISNNVCCKIKEYHDGSACVAINQTTYTRCDKFKDGSLSCSECESGYILMNGVCVTSNKIYSSVFQKEITISQIILNCIAFGDDGFCKECTTGKYAFKGLCVDEGKTLNQSGSLVTLTNCLTESNFSVCSNCSSGKYLNTFINTCCDIGYGYNSSCLSSLTVNKCNRFINSNVCNQCDSGYNLYSQSPSNICCPDYYYYDNSQSNCVDFRKRTTDCNNFFLNTFQCNIETCENGYIFNQHCCPYNYRFNTSSLSCEIIPNEIYCKEYGLNKCVKCMDSVNQYMENDICCPYTKYGLISNKTCQNISPSLNAHCIKFRNTTGTSGICLQCESNYYISEQNQCCPEGTYYNGSSCMISIHQCKFYEKVGNDYLCRECYPNYRLSKFRNYCCKLHQVLDTSKTDITEKCYQDKNIVETFPFCKKFDRKYLKCLECFEKDEINLINYYLSYDICCPIGQYKNLTSGNCEDITTNLTNFITNCTKYDQFTQKCTGCNDQYLINATQTLCIKVDENCLSKNYFNITTMVCSKCITNNYVSNNKCCPYYYYYNGTSCVRITDNFCTHYNTQCTKCAPNYYLTASNFCCQNGFYCSGVNVGVPGVIQNCNVYATSKSDCIKCQSGFSLGTLLTEAKICLELKEENCENAEIANFGNQNRFTCNQCMVNFFLTNNTSFILKNKRPKEIENCEKYNLAYLLEESTFECMVCKYPYYLNNGICVLRTKTQNCIEHEPSLDQCLNCKDNYYLDANNNCVLIPPECSFYENTGICHQCKRTTHLTLSNYTTNYVNSCMSLVDFNLFKQEATNPLYYKGYIDYCQKHLECDNVKLGGLEPEFEKFVNCYRCKDHDYNFIPFVSISFENNMTSVFGIQRFDPKTSSNLRFDENGLNHTYSGQCIKPIRSSFNINSNFQFNFPDNCAIGIINANLIPDATDSNKALPNSSKMSIFCGACKPGYKPLYSNLKFHVYSCQSIENCEIKSHRLNQCDKCAQNHVFAYNPLKGVDKTKCINYISNSFCIAANETDSKCQLCKKGFSLNHDQICEKLNITKCTEDSFSLINSFYMQDLEFIYSKEIFPGCNKCEEDYIGIMKNRSEINCLRSSYLEINDLIEESVYEENCEFYTIKNNLPFCLVCGNNTFATSDGKCINMSSKISNCKIQSDANNCIECDEAFVLINNICQAKAIVNCKEYQNSASVMTCKKCENGYHLKNGNCVEGKISYCLEYASDSQCLRCEKNYLLVTTEEKRNYCLKKIDNCDYYFEFDLNNFEFLCEKCEEGYQIIENTTPNYICNSLNQVPFCARYHKGDYINTSTFHCLECQSGYYLKDYRCLKRENIDSFCKDYDKNEDICFDCNENYYVSPKNKKCTVNPQGVFGCMEYKNEKECNYCFPDYYISNNKCVSLPEERKIKNCEAYASLSSCGRCAPGFVLDNKICKEPEVKNCKIYVDAKNCVECDEGFYIKKVDDYDTCVQMPSIDDCIKVNLEEPPTCALCREGYFFSNNKCSEIDEKSKILNCKFYNKEKKCLYCQEKFFKSKDGLNCKEVINSENCEFMLETEQPKCLLCNIGYFIDKDGVCKKYPNTVVTINNCILSDDKNPSLCLICDTGYYQSNNKCVAGKEAENNNINPNNNENPKDNQSFLKLCKVFWFGILILFILS